MPAATTKPWMRLEPRPSLRGAIHAVAAVVTPVLSIPFVLDARPGAPRVGVAVFCAALTVLFATSATYHRVDWSDRWLLRMKRADHIAIFVLLAGTYTGVAVMIFDGWQQAVVLLASWGTVVAGVVAASLGLFERRGFANTSYIALGWLALVLAPRLLERLSATELALIVAGGVIYTAGAIALALRRPDPWPTVFGYHEIWHVFTVIAAGCHAGAIWSLAA